MQEKRTPPRMLTVNKKTDHFFVSINKQGPHSFVMLGVYHQNKVRHLLCRVGKFGNTGAIKCDFHLKAHLPVDLRQYKGSYIYCNNDNSHEKKLYYIKSGCDLHLLSVLPDNLKKYKESYLYCKNENGNIKKLYYIKSDGTSEEVTINCFQQFENNLKKIKQRRDNQWHLTTEEVHSCITANGKHNLGIVEEVKIADFHQLDEDIDKINPQKASLLHLSGKQVEEMIESNGGHTQDMEPDYSMQMGFLCNALFFANKGVLMDERIWRENNRSTKITYQAYDITYEQYVEFVQVLEASQSLYNKYRCYKPNATTDDEVTLKLGSEKVLPPLDVTQIKTNNIDANRIKGSVKKLHIGNTCRHSAIALVEATQHAPVSSKVSSTFFMDLPYETTLEFGTPSEDIPFYVLPQPPTAFFESDKIKKKVITKLYERMENMLLLEPYSSDTQKKFLRLKELYLEIVGPNKNLSLNQLLKEIKSWKDQHVDTLKVLRKTYFWDNLPFIHRQSSTMKLITEIEAELERNQTLTPDC